MIVIKPMGGLGNQLFIYAAGRALSLRFDAPLKMDLSHYREQTFRSFLLDRYAIEIDEVTPGELAWFAARSTPTPLAKALAGIGIGPRTPWFAPTEFGYDAGFARVRPPAYLLGYFQSERHFSSHAAALRRELTLREEPDAANRALADRMRHPGSVCVHVRRTDYVTNQTFQQWAQACPVEYYQAAVALVRARVPDPEFFVFSDEPEWCRSHLGFITPSTVVDVNGEDRPQGDLALMAVCAHHIVANSTFSWWGAWLGEKAGQVVIAPRRWWSSGSLDDSTVVPERWLRL